MLKIITTEDGSHSLFDEELNETYHSTRGAKGESLHVFLKEGLEHWRTENDVEDVRMLEIGLGTGLNAFLTTLYAGERKLNIHFTSLEPYPVEKKVYDQLNFAENDLEKALLTKIHESEWEQAIQLIPDFWLHKTTRSLEHFETPHHFNVIYFDAFAPSKQPEVWSLENLKKCYDLLSSGGILTTYCAQGQFKRNFAEAGFIVETLQGAMGKKEMVRGQKH